MRAPGQQLDPYQSTSSVTAPSSPRDWMPLVRPAEKHGGDRNMQLSAEKSSKPLPRQFREIRLELARDSQHPAGSGRQGYRLIAPLDPEGRIDARLSKEHADACRVVRFRPEEDDVGHLVRRGKGWSFHYDIKGDEADEAGFRFADEFFVVGEYVSIREEDGMRTFIVTSVEHI